MRDFNDPNWWREAVIYQVYVRSFADSDGDGVGDLPGITGRLPYLRDLGVDALWITPFYTSPQNDHGYDVADYCDVDPLFGRLADADVLIARAHELGLKVIVDIVPNHTSSEHAWFQAALAAGPDSPERARFLFRTGKAGGEEPPNNWQSVFGGPAWTRVADTDQWYLHLFDSTQPDLDWRSPDVAAMFEDVLRFWLDRGADGFRIDVAHGLFKEASLRDRVETPAEETHSISDGGMVEIAVGGDEPMWHQPEVHEVYRSWRKILDSYDPPGMAVAEAWAPTPEAVAAFVRPDELHQSFNFAWLLASWSAKDFEAVIAETIATLAPVGASATWVLSNHDVTRHVSRYGGDAQGLARAKAATLVMLGLPGSSYIYQGEELGLEEIDVAPEDRQDPAWFRTGEPGRDGCRVPLPWSGVEPPFGFGPAPAGTQPWIPQPASWRGHTVADQDADPASTLSFYREALALRRKYAVPAGAAVDITVDGDLLSIRRGRLAVELNCGDEPTPLPAGKVLLSSGALADDGTLPGDTAAWVLVG